MSPDSQQKRRGQGERIVLSMMSLLILFGLLAGYFLLHASQKQEGKLGLISTSQVTISINEGPASEAAPVTGEPEPTATSTPARAAAGRSPGLVTEVLSTTGQADAGASASNKPAISTSAPSSAAGSQASARPATATATAATITGGGTGFVPSGSQPVLGGSSGGSTSGGPTSTPPPQQSGTVTPGAPTSTAVPQATASGPAPTAVPQATASGPAPTAVPTPAPVVPDEVSPPGHHSHLHIDGVVGPGAYTTGGIRVSNVGPVAFNYSVSMTTSGDATFASLLRLRIFLRVGDSCNYPGQPPAPATGFLPLTGDQVGTVLYDGNFAGGNKVGDPTVESASGDRHLEAGQSEVLCMEVFFPWTAGNAFQGLSVNGTQIFTAKSPE